VRCFDLKKEPYAMKNLSGWYLILPILFLGVVFTLNFYTKVKKQEEQRISANQKACEQSALIFYKREIAGTSTYLATARWDDFRSGCYLNLVGTSTTKTYRIGSGGIFGELEPIRR
jgi:hypothetical protein